MATITLNGNTLSARLGEGSFTSLGLSFIKTTKTTDSLVKEMNKLSGRINSASTVTNLDTSKNNVKKINNREEKKKSSLTLAYEKLDELVSDTGKVDSKVADKINERKDDFYKKYSYLKPKSEKSVGERIKDGFKKAWDTICDLGSAIADFFIDVGNWCKKNWKSLLCVLGTIIATVALVVACVLTFGGAAVLMAVLACVAVSLIGQLISDLVVLAVTGEWKSSWEDYLGAVLGGVIDGCLFLVPGLKGTPFGDMISAGVSTFFIGNLKNLTGKQDKSVISIFGESLADAGLSLLLNKGIDAIVSTRTVTRLVDGLKDGLSDIGRRLGDLDLVKTLKNLDIVKRIKDFDLAKRLKDGISSIPFMEKLSKENLNSYKDSFNNVMEKLLRDKNFADFSFEDLGKNIIAEAVDNVPKKIRDVIITPITDFVKDGVGGLFEKGWDFCSDIYDNITNASLNVVKYGLPQPVSVTPINININIDIDIDVNININ